MDKNPYTKTQKFEELIKIYKKIAQNGCYTVDGKFVPPSKVFGMSGQYRYKELLKSNLNKFKIKTILDYGSGQGSWDKNIEGTDKSLKEFLSVDKVYNFEPARNELKKNKTDCVVSFDVLEHVFISDIPWVVFDIFSYAKKFVFVNVASYIATKMINSDDNAHITVRPPLWWKGVFDCVGSHFPNISYVLLVSKTFKDVVLYDAVCHNEFIHSKNYTAIQK